MTNPWDDPKNYVDGIYQPQKPEPYVPPSTSWRPVENWWDGSSAPKPDILSRVCGGSLFYKGAVNTIIGESESGKSWLALLALKQAGGGVLIDMEDNGPRVADRMRPIGLAPQSVHYLRPREPFIGYAQAQLNETLDALPDGALVVVDGLNTLLEMNDWDNLSTADVTRAFRTVLEPMAERGLCVVVIDHMPHQTPGMKARAIGSQAKRSTVSGTSVHVASYNQFGRGKRGAANVRLLKDKNGWVEELVSEGDKDRNVATFTLDATTPGSYTIELGASNWVAKERREQDELVTDCKAIQEGLGEGPSTLAGISLRTGLDRQGKRLKAAMAQLLHDKAIEISGTHKGGDVFKQSTPPPDDPRW